MAIKTEDAFSSEELLSTKDAFEEEQPKKHWLESAFPTSAEEAKNQLTLGSAAKQGVKGLMDFSTIPTRAAATLTGQEFSDPTAYAAKPFVENKVFPKIEKGKELFSAETAPPMITPGSFSTPYRPSPEEVKGTAEVIGGTVSDPSFLLGVLGKIAGKTVKSAGSRIERAVLGKGAKSVLRDQGVSLKTAAENALEHGLGGDMQTVLDKTDDIIEGLEKNIDNITKGYSGPKKVNVEYSFYKARKYVDDHPLLFTTDKNEVLSAIKNLEDNVNASGFTGNIDVDVANNLKRSLKVKGIPSQSSPASQDAVFGLRMAMAEEIEKIVPEIKEQNAIYREILPARKIAMSRIVPEQARDPIGIGSMVSAGLGASLYGGSIPKAATAAAIYGGSKSGKVGQGLWDLGKILDKYKPVPYGGTVSGVRSIEGRP